jgi:glycosyltransferase involved in cell wall biosynthesis
MRAGRPIVASRVGGTPEAVKDGEHGWLVPPGDPAATAEALLNLLAEPSRARTMGAAARARWERSFTGQRMIADTERHYREALSAVRAAARDRVLEDLRGAAGESP